jgi:hypothetical protein
MFFSKIPQTRHIVLKIKQYYNGINTFDLTLLDPGGLVNKPVPSFSDFQYDVLCASVDFWLLTKKAGCRFLFINILLLKLI